MNKVLRLLLAMGLMAVVFVAGCQSDAQRIRATNEALDPPVATNTPVPRPTATNTPLVAEIDAIDLQDGDCINSSLPEGVSIYSVDIVPCNGPWQYRALNSFDVANIGGYPGVNYFSQQANERCDRRFSFLLYPLAESWTLGHGTVNCLQESFGLSVNDPAKLDRMVGYQALRAGECYNDAPESDYVLAEVVSCSGKWEYSVTNRFDIARTGSFPGDDFFDQEAYERCEEPYDSYLPPSPESWELGDSTVLCLEEGF